MFEDEDYLMRDHGKLNSSIFAIDLRYCTGKTCDSTQAQTNEFISGKYLAVTYFDNYFDSYDYSNPI